MKILIVDDDVRRSSELKEFLENETLIPFDVNCVADTDAAKGMLENSYFDVLILDVVVPRKNNQTASPRNSIALLDQLSRSARYKSPEKVISLTANSDDIQGYRERFEKYCLAVIEASSTSIGWKTKIVESLSFTFSSKATRGADATQFKVMTVHGIRTFGGWQEKLRDIVDLRTRGASFFDYKYGYFSAFSLVVPYFRNIEINKFYLRLVSLFDTDEDENKFIIFAHSFGTFLLAKSLQKYIASGRIPKVHTIVLSGSVLPEDFDWDFLRRHGVRIINECADNDHVLLLSKIFILDMGMAGRSGFHGFQNKNSINRFFLGGHSHCVKSSNFMEKYWLPVIAFNQDVVSIDNREFSFLKHEILEKIVSVVASVKYIFYFAIVFWILSLCYGALRVNSALKFLLGS